MLGRRAWLNGFASVAVVCLLAGPVLADAPVTGDRAAHQQLVAAFKKLFSLPGFRAKITSSQGQGLLEFARPDSYYLLSRVEAQRHIFETVKIGDKVATREAASREDIGGWQCRQARSSDTFFLDPTVQRGIGTLSVSRGPDTVIDGMRVHTFFAAGLETKYTVYVGSRSRLPKRKVAEGAGETIDYYDYGAYVVIVPPSCGP